MSATQISDRELRLGEVLAALLEAQERGDRLDRDEWLARHPEFAAELTEFFDSARRLESVAAPLREAVVAAAPVAPARRPGDHIGLSEPLGDYQIVREVGRGGMGVVYEAVQRSLGRRVALKVLPFAATLDPRQLQRFLNEARAAAGLHHTNIVPVFAVGQERGIHYYAMQFIEGRTLADLIAQQRGRSPAQVPTVAEVEGLASAPTVPQTGQATSTAPRDQAYFRQVAGWGIQAAEALDCAHSLGVVHRDIKPANLLVDAAGRLWVTDFGLAQVQSDVRLTMTGDLMGTLRYMSPEQALAQRVVIDHRTDVYSLGATLYELLTLQPAYGGIDRQELLRQIAFEESTAPRRVNKAVPAELETIVLKAMEKNPADRYATAQELADDLRHWLEDRPIRARRAGVVQRLRKLARRHRTAVGAAAICLLVTLLALGGTGGWVLSDRAARQQEAQARRREAEGKVEEALEAAKPGLRDGNPRDLALIAAAKSVEAQLNGGAVGPEMRRRAEQLLRDVRMLADLDEISLRQAETNPAASAEALTKMNEEGRFDNSGTAARYEAAFARYGIEVLHLYPADGAALVRDSAISEALLTGLDGWIQANPVGDPEQGRIARRVADAADDSAWRRDFRQAALASDLPRLKLLAGQPEALAQPPAMLAWQGRFLNRVGLFDEAQAILRGAQRRHPGDFWINYSLGAALVLCPPPQHPEEAIGYFRAAIAIRPGSAEAHSILGHTLEMQGDLDGATDAFQQALAVDPKFAIARDATVESLAAQGKLNEAIACYKDGFDLGPKDGNAHFALGDVYFRFGRHDEGIACYKKGLELAPGSRGTPNELGTVLANHGRLDEAIEVYREGVRNPKDAASLATSHFNLGVTLSRKGRHEEAFAEYREATRIVPDRPLYHMELGGFLYHHSRFKEAEDEFRAVVKLKPDYAPAFWAHEDLGNALYHQGRFKEAEDEYREAIRLIPANPVPYGHLCNALHGQGRDKDAEAVLSEAINSNPESGWLRVERGWVYADLGQCDKASAEFVKATECPDRDPRAWSARALLCLRDGNLDGYRKISGETLVLFTRADDADAAAGAVWTWALAPNTGTDPARPVSLAETVLAKSPMDHWKVTVLGAALYRAGRFAEAVKRLTEATGLNPDPYRTDMIASWYFLALAHHRLGHADEARCWLVEATQATEEALKPPAEPLEEFIKRTGTIPPNWDRKLTLRLLRREAEELIQGPGTKPAK